MTAERQQDSQDDPWWGEHVHRYHEASRLIHDTDTVLDLACGLGFGTSILSSTRRASVHGCDLSAEAVVQAHRKYSGPRTHFSIANGTSLPFKSDQFEAVTSFETLEHLQNDRGFLRELRRVLKPNGMLILSTPNGGVSNPVGRPTNPFHVREYTLLELRVLLEAIFRDVSIRGQRFTRFSHGRSRGSLGLTIERTLYMRGVRKLPLFVRDLVSRHVTGKPHYPTPLDFDFIDDDRETQDCRTLFATCRK